MGLCVNYIVILSLAIVYCYINSRPLAESFAVFSCH